MLKSSVRMMNTVKGLFGMVNITEKIVQRRQAQASGRVLFSKEGFEKYLAEGSTKGDVKASAEIAAIHAAKQTSALLPMCHPLNLECVRVQVIEHKEDNCIEVKAWTLAEAKTGVEMEALTAVSIGCLHIYDMCKPICKELRMSDIHLEYKKKD